METTLTEQTPASDSYDVHTMHLWSPFHLQVDAAYPFYPTSLRSRLLFYGWKTIALLICPALDFFVVGFRFSGWKIMRKAIKEGAMFCPNHIHPLDCTMAAIPFLWHRADIAALQSNFGIPVVRHLIHALGALPVPEDPAVLPAFSAASVQALKDGRSLIFYPEGVLRPYCDQIRKFHPGAFLYAAAANKPVVPMVFTLHQPRGWMRLVRRKPWIHLTALDPIYPNPSVSPRKEALRMKKECRTAMQQAMDDALSAK